MKLIDSSIDRRSVFITSGTGDGDTATFSVLLDADAITAARLPVDWSGSVLVETRKDGRANALSTGRIAGAVPATDTGPTDTGPTDTGPTDTGPTDTGPTDTGPIDTGLTGWTTGFEADSASDVMRPVAVLTAAVS